MYFIRHRLRALLLLPIAMASGTSTGSQAQDRAPQNAAEYYQQAFAANDLDVPDANAYRAEVRTGRVTAATKAALDRNRAAVRLSRLATTAAPAHWGVGPAAGPFVEKPWLTEGYRLAILLDTAARMAARAGNGQEAAELLLANLALARHLGMHPDFVSEMVQLTVEQMATEAAGAVFTALSEPEARALQAAMDALPPDRPLAEAIRVEGQGAGEDWFRPVDPLATLDTNVVLGLPFQFGRQWNHQRSKWIEGVKKLHADAADALAQPRDRRAEALKQLFSRLQEYGPLAEMLAPNLPEGAVLREAVDVRLAMLRAALAYMAGGEQALQGHLDPTTGQPFAFEKTADGFTLRSTAAQAGEPVQLQVRRP